MSYPDPRGLDESFGLLSPFVTDTREKYPKEYEAFDRLFSSLAEQERSQKPIKDIIIAHESAVQRFCDEFSFSNLPALCDIARDYDNLFTLTEEQKSHNYSIYALKLLTRVVSAAIKDGTLDTVPRNADGIPKNLTPMIPLLGLLDISDYGAPRAAQSDTVGQTRKRSFAQTVITHVVELFSSTGMYAVPYFLSYASNVRRFGSTYAIRIIHNIIIEQNAQHPLDSEIEQMVRARFKTTIINALMKILKQKRGKYSRRFASACYLLFIESGVMKSAHHHLLSSLDENEMLDPSITGKWIYVKNIIESQKLQCHKAGNIAKKKYLICPVCNRHIPRKPHLVQLFDDCPYHGYLCSISSSNAIESPSLCIRPETLTKQEQSIEAMLEYLGKSFIPQKFKERSNYLDLDHFLFTESKNLKKRKLNWSVNFKNGFMDDGKKIRGLNGESRSSRNSFQPVSSRTDMSPFKDSLLNLEDKLLKKELPISAKRKFFVCANCGEKDPKRILVCKNCMIGGSRFVVYCSEKCQKEHQQKHAEECGVTQQAPWTINI